MMLLVTQESLTDAVFTICPYIHENEDCNMPLQLQWKKKGGLSHTRSKRGKQRGRLNSRTTGQHIQSKQNAFGNHPNALSRPQRRPVKTKRGNGDVRYHGKTTRKSTRTEQSQRRAKSDENVPHMWMSVLTANLFKICAEIPVVNSGKKSKRRRPRCSTPAAINR